MFFLRLLLGTLSDIDKKEFKLKRINRKAYIAYNANMLKYATRLYTEAELLETEIERLKTADKTRL